MPSLPSDWLPWVTMWSLAVTIYAGCKGLTWFVTPRAGVTWRDASFLLAWPGMDGAAFLDRHALSVERPGVLEWAAAAIKTQVGICLLGYIAPRLIVTHPLAAGWLGMAGIVMVLHFGVFHLLSCLWRSLGVDARPLMDSPLRSRSLSEFWGRRWNRAFRDLTYQCLFRPLQRHFGPRGTLLIGFLVSGLIHELVISWPAGGGYGGPTMYFMLQAAGLLFERTEFGRRIGLGLGWQGWAFTAAMVIGPAGILFHRPFVERVILWFLNDLTRLL